MSVLPRDVISILMNALFDGARTNCDCHKNKAENSELCFSHGLCTFRRCSIFGIPKITITQPVDTVITKLSIRSSFTTLFFTERYLDFSIQCPLRGDSAGFFFRCIENCFGTF